jgi:hypothetical protein
MIEEQGPRSEDELAKQASESSPADAMRNGTYLQLVLASLSGWGRVEEIDCENLSNSHVSFRASKSIQSALIRPNILSAIVA